MRNRVLDPRFGKWLTRDPIGVAGGWNLYRYVEGRPNSFWDPMGLAISEPGKYQWHHLIPQKFHEQLEAAGVSKELLHSADMGRVFTPGTHTVGKFHTDWNVTWNDWIDQNKGNLTDASVREFAEDMAKREAFAPWLANAAETKYSHTQWGNLKSEDKAKYLIEILPDSKVSKGLRLLAASGKAAGNVAVKLIGPVLVYVLIDTASKHGVAYAVMDTVVPIELAKSGIAAGQQAVSDWVDSRQFNLTVARYIKSGDTPQEAVKKALQDYDGDSPGIDGKHKPKSDACP